MSSGDQVSQSIFCNLNQNDAYVYGSCVKTASYASDTSPNDFMRFPQSSSSFAGCIYDAPLKFLETNKRSFCSNNINAVRNYF